MPTCGRSPPHGFMSGLMCRVDAKDAVTRVKAPLGRSLNRLAWHDRGPIKANVYADDTDAALRAGVTSAVQMRLSA